MVIYSDDDCISEIMRRLSVLLLSFLMVISGMTNVFAAASDEALDYQTWTTADFTYADYEKRLYGCDYSRDFVIEGKVVSGFSESGLQKLEHNKDLVIPRTDNEGNALVGVGEGAFKNKGLTSVEFPSGMLVDYDDTLTHNVTKRGNFIIADSAFSGNNLTSVVLPSGVIAVLPNAFLNNKLTSVTLPRTIWWIENQAFAKNQISKVGFPSTCDFQLEIHGIAFGNNRIKSVKLPYYTAVVNKTSFVFNPGMEALASDAPSKYKTYTDLNGESQTAGLVYMYTDNPKLADMDRIHHDGKTVESQYSYVQRLVINEGTDNPDPDPGENPGSGDNSGSGEGSDPTPDPGEADWALSDFVIEGTCIKGLSEKGIAKRASQSILVLPEKNSSGEYITEIGAAAPGGTGLFASKDEKFSIVELPSRLEVIGDFAFQDSGIKECAFPHKLKTIGLNAFSMNNLESVILPDSVTSLGKGAFATNKTIKAISLSKGLTEIPDAAFGCSDAKNYMTGLTQITIPEGITRIGQRAFAGNNFHSITIPSTVKEIGAYAFSTKNYLKDPCKVTLNEGLEIIGDDAFRNKVIDTIIMPESVKKMGKNTFRKEYSDGSSGIITEVILTSEAQFSDQESFPENAAFHKFTLIDASGWLPSDFTSDALSDTEAVITGLSDEGILKAKVLTSLTVPSLDTGRKSVVAIAEGAFKDSSFCELNLPDTVQTIGAEAFKGNKLTVFNAPASLSTVEVSAFENNLLDEVNFVSACSDLTLKSKAFADNNLVYVGLPDSIRSVSGDCFEENKGSFGEVYIFVKNPASDASIANTSDGNSTCQKLSKAAAPDPSKPWDVNDFTWNDKYAAVTGWSDYGMVKRCYNKDMVIPCCTPSGVEITSIADNAFSVPDSEVEVTKFGIESPGGLTSVAIPSSVKRIGDKAFRQNALSEIDLKSVETIGAGAFYGNSIKTLSIPDTVTSMGDGCFATNSIDELTLSKSLKVIPMGCFSMNIRLENVVIPEGVTEIQQTAFAGARLTKLTIPSTVIRIGRKAFHLHHLTELTVPGNVKVVEESAFEGTYKETTLKTLVLEDGVEEIGKYAFKEGLLEQIDLPESLKALGDEPFLNNTGYNGSHIVRLNTHFKHHLDFASGSSYEVVYSEPGSGESGGSSGGAGEGGGGGGVPVEPSEDPISNSKGDSGSITTNVNLSDKVSAADGKVEVKVDSELGDKIVENAVNNTSAAVEINASAGNAGNAAKTAVSIPAKTYSDILAKTDAETVSIKTDAGTVVLDRAALIAVADKAGTEGDVKLIVETKENNRNKVEVSLKIETSNGAVSDFKGGNATVTVPVSEELAGKKIVCVYIDENGKYTKMEGKLASDGKSYTFTTGHFSTYAILEEAEADAVIDEQNKAEAPAVKVAKASVKLKAYKGGKLKVTASAKNATGYRVYYKKSTWKKYKTYTKGNIKTLNKTFKKLSKGKYTVKVKAFHKADDGKTTWGADSSIKKITVR